MPGKMCPCRIQEWWGGKDGRKTTIRFIFCPVAPSLAGQRWSYIRHVLPSKFLPRGGTRKGTDGERKRGRNWKTGRHLRTPSPRCYAIYIYERICTWHPILPTLLFQETFPAPMKHIHLDLTITQAHPYFNLLYQSWRLAWAVYRFDTWYNKRAGYSFSG